MGKRLKTSKYVPDNQATFTSYGLKMPAKQVEEKLLSTSKYSCPFCLYTDYGHKFTVKSGNKIMSRVKCPECGNSMLRRTLLSKMTAKEYGKWMAEYVYTYRGGRRIQWAALKQRIKEYGIASQFWEAYKARKAEIAPQTEEDYSRLYEEYQSKQDEV